MSEDYESWRSSFTDIARSIDFCEVGERNDALFLEMDPYRFNEIFSELPDDLKYQLGLEWQEDGVVCYFVQSSEKSMVTKYTKDAIDNFFSFTGFPFIGNEEFTLEWGEENCIHLYHDEEYTEDGFIDSLCNGQWMFLDLISFGYSSNSDFEYEYIFQLSHGGSRKDLDEIMIRQLMSQDDNWKLDCPRCGEQEVLPNVWRSSYVCQECLLTIPQVESVTSKVSMAEDSYSEILGKYRKAYQKGKEVDTIEYEDLLGDHLFSNGRVDAYWNKQDSSEMLIVIDEIVIVHWSWDGDISVSSSSEIECTFCGEESNGYKPPMYSVGEWGSKDVFGAICEECLHEVEEDVYDGVPNAKENIASHLL